MVMSPSRGTSRRPGPGGPGAQSPIGIEAELLTEQRLHLHNDARGCLVPSAAVNVSHMVRQGASPGAGACSHTVAAHTGSDGSDAVCSGPAAASRRTA